MILLRNNATLEVSAIN